MNKFLLSLLLPGLLFSSSSLAFAQTPSSSLHSQLKSAVQTLRQDTRDQFKAKLAQIKDAHKQALITRVDTRIQEINTRRTKDMAASLTKLSEILDRVVAKTATVTPAPSQDLVTTARSKIASSQTAVATQAAKQYIISLTTDDLLRQNVTTTLTNFKTDLEATHQTVIDAKEAVIQAIKSLEPTSDVSPTVTATP